MTDSKAVRQLRRAMSRIERNAFGIDPDKCEEINVDMCTIIRKCAAVGKDVCEAQKQFDTAYMVEQAILSVLEDDKEVDPRGVCPHCGEHDNPCEKCGKMKESHILRYCDACSDELREARDDA